MSSSTKPGSMLDRRRAMAAMGVGVAGAAVLGQEVSPLPVEREPLSALDLGWDSGQQAYVLPPLPYDYDALEPAIDEETMRLHHDKHHAGYVRGLNDALAALRNIRGYEIPPGEMRHWSRDLAFNASGHFLHVLFWRVMSPDGGGEPTGALAEAIRRDFGSFRQFAFHFETAAASVEGSGWAILVFEPLSERLMVMQAQNHQNLTAWGVVPLLPVDVWEHAYYLSYRNRRQEYLKAFMTVVDWGEVGRMYERAVGT